MYTTMYSYQYIDIGLYTYIHTYVNIHVYTTIHSYQYIHICLYTYIHTYVNIQMYTTLYSHPYIPIQLHTLIKYTTVYSFNTHPCIRNIQLYTLIYTTIYSFRYSTISSHQLFHIFAGILARNQRRQQLQKSCRI